MHEIGQDLALLSVEELRERIATYFDPLPFWYPPLEGGETDCTRYPLTALTQRPMMMYHSWDSQNAWLRQIHSHNYLHVHPRTAEAAGIIEGAWCWVESRWGRVRCMLRTFFGYQGSLLYEMQAGMGDAVFAPQTFQRPLLRGAGLSTTGFDAAC